MAKVCAAMRASFSAMAACLPMGAPHCTRSRAHSRAIAQAALGEAGAGGGEREAAGIERGQRDAQAFALGQQDVLARDADVGEADDGVVERLQAHEAAAVRDLDAGRVHIHDEGGDAAAALSRRRRASWP